MVVFTCGHCGESVTKPKVEKHYLTKCRNRNPNLSCMDCFKDFLGNSYEEHIKCITEEQRYSAKGFVAKEKKGELKQNAWVEMVQEVLDEQNNAPANVLRILNTVSKHNNTPRKKPKFVNFVKNVCGHKTNPKDIDAAWDMISVKLAALALNKNQNGKTNSSAEEEKNDESKIEDEQEVSSTSDTVQTNGNTDENSGVEVSEEKGKKSKKQRKEEKKRQKYEAELQSAAQVPTEEAEEEQKSKKDKKKNKGDVSGDEAESNKNKKRKRQDTVNEIVAAEVSENTSDMPQIQNLQVTTEKTKKKKAKIDQDEEDEETLHNQNVANGEDNDARADKFNWHAVIMSVLEKKGNEVAFKRLQKKVLGEYSEVTGRDVDDRIADKFIKKLRSAPNVRVDKNRVILVQ